MVDERLRRIMDAGRGFGRLETAAMVLFGALLVAAVVFAVIMVMR